MCSSDLNRDDCDDRRQTETVTYRLIVVFPHDFALAVIEIEFGNGTLPQTEIRQAEISSLTSHGGKPWGLGLIQESLSWLVFGAARHPNDRKVAALPVAVLPILHCWYVG